MIKEKQIFMIKVVDANISRVVEATQDPYTVIKYGKQTQKTTVKQDRAKNPQWNEILTFEKTEDNVFQIEIWDYDDETHSDLIGKGSMDLTEFRKMNMFKSKEVTLLYKEKPAATLRLEIQLTVEKAEKKAPVTIEEKKKHLIQPEFFASFNVKMDAINKKLDLGSVDEFVKDKGVRAILKAALVEMSRKRPQNPIKFLGEYLLKNDPSAVAAVPTKKK